MSRRIATVLLCLAVAAVACGRETRSDCRPVNGVAYWSHTVLFPLAQNDAGGRRMWARDDHASEVCFSAPLSEVNDPLVRTEGLVVGLRELAKDVTRDAAQWDTDARTQEVRNKLRTLVRRDFSSAQEYEDWLLENGDYLRWSDQADALVIDEEARAAGRPVVPKRFVDLSAADYWYYDGMQWLRDVKTEGGVVSGSYWSGGQGAAYVPFRTAGRALDDRAAKEEGYRRAVAFRLTFFDGASPDGAQEIAQHLQRLTGQRFRDAKSWKAWWVANRQYLRLSADGSHLETRNSE